VRIIGHGFTFQVGQYHCDTIGNGRASHAKRRVKGADAETSKWGIVVGQGRLKLREAINEDYDVSGRVMFDAIHAGASVYSEAQRRAWLDAAPQGERWAVKLSGQRVFLAERDGAVIGFMTLAGDYLDLAFVATKSQGQGVFRALYAQVELQARTQGETRLHAHASLMARPAFEAVGFYVIRSERVARAGEYLDRLEMEKTLK